MAIAKLLKDINLFVDGRGHAGKVDEFDPPKLTVKTEDFRPGGMDMPVKVDMGMEPMECKFTLSSADRETLKLFGLVKGEPTPLTLRGSQEDDRTGEAEAVVHHLRGRITEVDWGTWKPGEKGPCTLMAALRYYKVEVGGEVTIEIDPENMKRVIDGVDQLAERRAALGI